MDKMGVGALIVGIILLALGGYGVYYFQSEVIFFLKGVIGIAALVIGIFLVIFGALLIKE
ncbi:MAG: hypothetical protein NT074_01795 [Methanomicrobiales archaeon]|jgi:hypothetical protein|nr:hypothetical protein [Methanomicrobiales archaeon]